MTKTTGASTSNGFSEKERLINMELRKVTITGMRPIYSDRREYVYEINVQAV